MQGLSICKILLHTQQGVSERSELTPCNYYDYSQNPRHGRSLDKAAPCTVSLATVHTNYEVDYTT